MSIFLLAFLIFVFNVVALSSGMFIPTYDLSSKDADRLLCIAGICSILSFLLVIVALIQLF